MKTVITHSATAETNRWQQSASIEVTILGDSENAVQDGLRALERAYKETKKTLERYGREKRHHD